MVNLASPPKCRQHANGTPHPCNCHSNDKNELQSIPASARRANEASVTSFAQQLFSCFKLRISLCCTIRRSLSKAALGPKRRNFKSCKFTVSNNNGQLFQHNLFQRRLLDQTLCVLTKTHSQPQKKHRILRCLKQTRPTGLGPARNKQKNKEKTSSHRAEPRRLASST